MSALKQTRMLDALRSLLMSSPERSKPANTEKLIRALHQFALLASNFGPAERRMGAILGLDPLIENDSWIKLITEPGSEAVRMLFSSVGEALRYLPRFVELIEPDFLRAVVVKSEEVPKVLQGKSLLTVIAIEERNQFSGPQRLIEVIQSIMLMYEAFAIISEQSADDLVVLACDSGSDKSFDFLGAAKLMEQVKELILSLWDKVVYFREKKAGERIALVAKSLPVIEEIAKLRASGALAPEKAEIVSRKIMEGVEKFLTNGATIPEIVNVSAFNSRALLAPQVKLLTDIKDIPPPEEFRDASAREEEPMENGLSIEERQELKRLVAKLQNSEKVGAEGGEQPEGAEDMEEN